LLEKCQSRVILGFIKAAENEMFVNLMHLLL
jgi:hypothetical protein